MRAVAPLRLRRHYMIDVETTSLATETAIVSLACVPFSPEVGVMSAPSECLNLRVHWSGGQQPGRHIDTKTMEWWQSRSQRALAELRAPIRQKLDDALNALAQFLGEDAIVWSNDGGCVHTIASSRSSHTPTSSARGPERDPATGPSTRRGSGAPSATRGR